MTNLGHFVVPIFFASVGAAVDLRALASRESLLLGALQGASKDASVATNNAIKLYLEQQGNKAGDYTIKFQEYDDSTAAKGQWDDGQCTKNATAHVQNKDEVAIMGTYNSGCAKIAR